jgi:hypothetical protein
MLQAGAAMANLSTINGTRSFGGSVFATGMRLEVNHVVADRADAQRLKLAGKRLHQGCRPLALRPGHCPELGAAYSATLASQSEPWQWRALQVRTSPSAVPAATEVPARAWASLIISRATLI